MPSPFPGMDPFIENQVWEDFHHEYIAVVRETLTSRLRPRYVVRVEKRVYVEHELDEAIDIIRPDVSVLEDFGREPTTGRDASAPTALAGTPVVLTLPLPEPKRESFLTIRDRETMEVITIIEVLSPGKKRPGSDGRREYLSKRETVIQSRTHLVELDLLRGGERLPTVERLPSADYYAFVSRGSRRPRVEVFHWTLRQPLPAVTIPLAGQDLDVSLELQSVFQTVYDRTGYDYSLDYRLPIMPALKDVDAAWTQELLRKTSAPQ